MFANLSSIDEIKDALLEKLSPDLTEGILEHNTSWFLIPDGPHFAAAKQAESLVRLIESFDYGLIDALLLIKSTGANNAVEIVTESVTLPRTIQLDINKHRDIFIYLVDEVGLSEEEVRFYLTDPNEEIWLLFNFIKNNAIHINRRVIKYLIELPSFIVLRWKQLMESKKAFEAEKALLVSLKLNPEQIDALLASDLTANDVDELDPIKIAALIKLKKKGLKREHILKLYHFRQDHIKAIATLLDKNQNEKIEDTVNMVAVCSPLDVQMLLLGFSPEKLQHLNSMQKYALIVLQPLGLKVEHFSRADKSWFNSYDHIIALENLLSQYSKNPTPELSINALSGLTGSQAIWLARGLSRKAVILPLNEHQRLALLILKGYGVTPQHFLNCPWFNSNDHIIALHRLLYKPAPRNDAAKRNLLENARNRFFNAYADTIYLSTFNLDLNLKKKHIPVHEVAPEAALAELKGLKTNELKAIQSGLRRKDIKQIGAKLLQVYLDSDMPAHNLHGLNAWQQTGILAYHAVNKIDLALFHSSGLKSQAHYQAFQLLFAKFCSRQYSKPDSSPEAMAMAIVELSTEKEAEQIIKAHAKENDFTTEIMFALQSYIERIALTKLTTENGAIDFKYGFKLLNIFGLFEDSRARSREVNYELARHLLYELGDGKKMGTVFDKLYIDSFRKSLSATRDIHSKELNTIIMRARTHIAAEEKLQPTIMPRLIMRR